MKQSERTKPAKPEDHKLHHLYPGVDFLQPPESVVVPEGYMHETNFLSELDMEEAVLDELRYNEEVPDFLLLHGERYYHQSTLESFAAFWVDASLDDSLKGDLIANMRQKLAGAEKLVKSLMSDMSRLIATLHRKFECGHSDKVENDEVENDE